MRMTGLSLRFVNNWMSNYRVRVWRPALVSLGRDAEAAAADAADADADAADSPPPQG